MSTIISMDIILIFLLVLLVLLVGFLFWSFIKTGKEKDYTRSMLASVIDTVGEAIIAADQHGCIIMTNQAAEDMWGYDFNKLIGMNLRDLMPENYRDSHTKGMERYLNTGDAKILGRRIELEGLHFSGAVFPMEIVISETKIDQVVIFTAALRDISDRIKSEHGMKSSKLLLETVINTVGEAIITVDKEGSIIMTNQAAADTWGYNLSDLLGMNLRELMPEKYRAAHTSGMARYLGGADAVVLNQRIELEGLHASGAIFPMEILISETNIDDDKLFTAALRNITERKRDERWLYQAQRREAIVALTGGIARDFNNLHSVILGNLRFLKDDLGKASDDIKEVLADAISATNDSVELTKRLMSYSRNQAVKPKMINVNHLVSELVPFLTSTLGNSIKLSTDLSPNILQINVDPDQLENALLNLVLNSKDAMPMGGGIVIKVSGGHSDAINYSGSAGGSDSFLEEGDYVIISVTDNGGGIKVENILAVFEPFFTTKDIGEGSGLGLSMVYGFCQQSNGNCTIDSDVGKATTVTMYIPRCDEG